MKRSYTCPYNWCNVHFNVILKRTGQSRETADKQDYKFNKLSQLLLLMDTILCDELIQQIFNHLPPPSSATISLVSKRWRHLLRSSLTTLHLHLSPSHPPPPTLSSFLSTLTYLSSLTLSSGNTSGDITTVFSDNLLISITNSNLTRLTRLHISTGPVSILPLIQLSIACPKLSSLSIILSRRTSPLQLQLLSRFSSLLNLTLNFSGNVTSPESISVVSQQFTVSSTELRLQTLSLSGIGSGDYALNWLWNNCSYETLTKLVFENCEGVGDTHSFASFIKRVTHLHELELKTCRSIVSLLLLNLAHNHNSYNSLSSLLIYDGGDGNSLLHFIRESRCNNLQKLDLRLPLDLDDSHIIEISKKCKRLRDLRLQSCCMVTTEALKTLSLALTDQLVELGLTNCDIINPKTGLLVELAQNLRTVKILDLSYNHTLFDKEFVSMIGSLCDLRTLKLRGCSRLSDVSLISLCKNCKKLESVDVVYCHGIKVEGVEFMVMNLRELRKVKVEDWKVSEDARRWMNDKFIEVQE
ncbi:hypothetical protein QVD17_18557 [Tagetes erecta]|uniref:F-box domain-containing protein n=1 Tax=Tagetes erecta TaxID=13708 RepID=A0AAD8KHZ0_TARER|nr:hypothetical protein QVD17_18557 [Tagetes erecta]